MYHFTFGISIYSYVYIFIYGHMAYERHQGREFQAGGAGAPFWQGGGESDCGPIDSHEGLLRSVGGSQGVVDDTVWNSHRYV